MRISRWTLVAGLAMAAIGLGFLARQLPVLAANALLHPLRLHFNRRAPNNCEDVVFAGAGVALRGWRCRAAGAKRGTVVYLHGITDNRSSGIGVAERFGARGFDLVAYDSRGHGESGGDACTYGYFEKRDLSRVLDTLDPRGIVLFGTSLGAAVALQAAADDRRVAAVVAAETFSDLRTIARDRAPFFFTEATIRKAFALAEERGGFKVDAVSPISAAPRITAPVLLIHGELDRETPPEHSRRVFAALRGPKRLILVPGAGHNTSLRADVWREIDGWIDSTLGSDGPDGVGHAGAADPRVPGAARGAFAPGEEKTLIRSFRRLHRFINRRFIGYRYTIQT